jgi:hypothetical protein
MERRERQLLVCKRPSVEMQEYDIYTGAVLFLQFITGG